MTVRQYLIGVILCLTIITPSFANEQEIIIGIGKGMDDTLIQSKPIADAEQWEISWAWDLDKSFTSEYGYAQWWFQVGYLKLTGTHLGVEDELTLFQIKPIIRLYPSGEKGQFFAEAGLGAAKLSKKSFEQIVIQTKGNFVIHAAIGWDFNETSKLSLRYSHYSNGYIHTPNPGIDAMAINYHWSF